MARAADRPGWLARVLSRVLNTAPAIAAGSALGVRGYSMARPNNAWADWTTITRDPNAALRQGLRVMRARSRDISRNEDYARGFVKRARTNVVGRAGVQVRFDAGASGLSDDTVLGIAGEFVDWSARGSLSLCGQYSWRGLQRAMVANLVRDGEVLLRRVRGREAGNRWGYAVEMIDPDLLDLDYTERLANGNRVVMGVELGHGNRPVAYHILTQHPDALVASPAPRRRVRVDARSIVHLFDAADDVGLVRGVPWFNPTAKRLRQMGEYEEAELLAARIGASKMGFFSGGAPHEFVPDIDEGEIEGEGGPAAMAEPTAALNRDGLEMYKVQPGEFGVLPEGAEFVPFDPQHPTGAYPAFTKTVLRGAAAGLGVSYVEFTGDLEGVNYSSIRQGVLSDRDQWGDLQGLLIEGLEVIVRDWLEILELAVPAYAGAPAIKRTFMPRGWSWVDPQKEIGARVTELALGVTSRQRIAQERGLDFAAVQAELAEEEGGPRDYAPPALGSSPPKVSPAPGPAEEGDALSGDQEEGSQ